MSTRGRIGVLRPDGRVESIYNHYDSYIDGLGAALKKITDPKVVDELIALGNRKGTYADEDWHDKSSLFNEPGRFYDSEEEFFKNDDDWSDYRYLFKNGEWSVSRPDGWDRIIEPLTKPSKIYQAKAGTSPNLRRRFKSPLDQANELLGGR